MPKAAPRPPRRRSQRRSSPPVDVAIGPDTRLHDELAFIAALVITASDLASRLRMANESDPWATSSVCHDLLEMHGDIADVGENLTLLALRAKATSAPWPLGDAKGNGKVDHPHYRHRVMESLKFLIKLARPADVPPFRHGGHTRDPARTFEVVDGEAVPRPSFDLLRALRDWDDPQIVNLELAIERTGGWTAERYEELKGLWDDAMAAVCGEGWFTHR